MNDMLQQSLNSSDAVIAITPLVSFKVLHIFEFASFALLLIPIAIFGIAANIIIITVYSKTGFSETTHITFFVLALADLLTCVCKMVVGLTILVSNPYTKALIPPNVVRVSLHVVYCVIYHVLSLSSWVTATIAAERCMCIVLPLKVKLFITRRTILCLVLAMGLIQTVAIGLNFSFGKSIPPRLTLVFWTFSVPSTICFSVVIIATIFMVVKLRISFKWRASTTTTSTATGPTASKHSKPSTPSSSSDKERRVVASVTAICIIYIVCFFPNACRFVASFIEPRFSNYDPYLWTLYMVIYSFSFLMQTISSSVNIIVYYRMSSLFRKTFRSLFSVVLPCFTSGEQPK